MKEANAAHVHPWFRWQEAMVAEGVRSLRQWSRAPEVWRRFRDYRKGASPAEVVYEEDRVRVLHYLSPNKPKYRVPLVFIYALVNRPYILDLKMGRSVVAHFVAHGFDTYLVDWGTPTLADKHRGLNDYVDGYMARVLKFLSERTGRDQVNMLGYCMGGTLSAIFTALHPEKIKNLILLAAGIDFATRDGLLNLWTQSQYFDVDRFIEAYGNCPPEFLQACFLLLRPVQNLVQKPINLVEHLDEDKFLADFVATETWLNDNIPVPGTVFREFVKYLYQENQLVQNRLRIGGRLVDLKEITCPVLNIMAERDDLVPCSQSEPFNRLVGSKDRETLLLHAGHVGLAIGTRAQVEIWPHACQWLARRDRQKR